MGREIRCGRFLSRIVGLQNAYLKQRLPEKAGSEPSDQTGNIISQQASGDGEMLNELPIE